jgi:hypothetical protein
MSQQQQNGLQDHVDYEEQASAAREGARASMQTQVKQSERRKQNPQFFDQVTDADIDAGEERHTESSFAAWLSSQHQLANRRQEFERQSELLDRNRVEREIARGTPGLKLRQHPDVLATMDGLDWSPTEGIQQPVGAKPAIMDTGDHETVRDVGDVATARKSQGIGAELLHSLTNAVTEHRQTKQEDKEARGYADKIAGAFR